jgi:hypothetical protein
MLLLLADCGLFETRRLVRARRGRALSHIPQVAETTTGLRPGRLLSTSIWAGLGSRLDAPATALPVT